MEKNGVSPVIATVLLICLTIVVGGAIVFMLGTSKAPQEPIQAVVRVDLERDKLVVRHQTGSKIMGAFKLVNGGIQWMTMEVRVNGVKVDVTGGARLDGSENLGVVHFGPGHELKLPIDIKGGETVTVVYVPYGQVLDEKKF